MFHPNEPIDQDIVTLAKAIRQKESGLTMFDFCAKAPIAISTIMSYRYYNGEFTTKDDVIMNNILNPEEAKKRVKEWKKGKSLLSIMKEENGKLTVDKQYYK